jgi:hypothetical protein
MGRPSNGDVEGNGGRWDRMKPGRAAGESAGRPPAEGLPAGAALPVSVRLRLEPFGVVIGGCAYRTEPTTIVARRDSAPVPFVQTQLPAGEAGGSSGSSPAGGSAASASKDSPTYSFRWTGRDWAVLFGGGKLFYLQDSLAAKATDYLLHHPNEPIQAPDLEVQLQPEKAEARARDSIQPESDERALREYRRDLPRLEAEQKKAQAAGAPERVARLEEDIQALKAALSGGSNPDAGERAYDNLRKSLRVMLKHLGRGGPEERAFGEHLRTHLSLGFECLYSQPQGRIWA